MCITPLPTEHCPQENLCSDVSPVVSTAVQEHMKQHQIFKVHEKHLLHLLRVCTTSQGLCADPLSSCCFMAFFCSLYHLFWFSINKHPFLMIPVNSPCVLNQSHSVAENSFVSPSIVPRLQTPFLFKWIRVSICKMPVVYKEERVVQSSEILRGLSWPLLITVNGHNLVVSQLTCELLHRPLSTVK